MRIGIGYDVHKLRKGRKLYLGGELIPYPKGLLGHSDADVLLHTIIDALIGALGAGSIGDYFPDYDPKFKDIPSLQLLIKTADLITRYGYKIINIDSTIVCEEPKLGKYIGKMRRNIASVLRLSESKVNVKAKTEEGLGYIGQKKAISAYAVCLLIKAEENEKRKFPI